MREIRTVKQLEAAWNELRAEITQQTAVLGQWSKRKRGTERKGLFE
jgi:hypothetical protein